MILLIGAEGQLGKEFRNLFNRLNIDYIATHHKVTSECMALNLTDKNQLEALVKTRKIDIIINCAAYNNVDQAEKETEQVFKVNRDAPKNLARLARDIGSILITYSTDFVFDGNVNHPYVETDQPNPLNQYGKSKLQGEQAVLGIYDQVYVIRSSWVFGQGNRNFIRSVSQWSRTTDQLTIADDQISAPTYAQDLASYSWDLIMSGKYGLYHISNGGSASKFDYARFILNKIGWHGDLIRGKTSDFDLLARRPAYSKLNSAKVEMVVGKQLPLWQDAVDRYFIDGK